MRVRADKRILYVGNLQDVSRKEIYRMFGFYGTLIRIWLSNCGSFGFVEFAKGGDANFARRRLNGAKIRSNTLIVDWADVQ